MRTTLRRSVVHLCGCLALAATAGNGRAGFISGGGGLEGLGTFTGHVDYTAADAGHSTLSITLWNTSPAANGGFLTAFAFRNPFGLISGVTLSSTNPNFGPLGEPGFQGDVHAPPFGSFDLGASTTGAFLGGGSPVGGIATGESATFVFALTGAGLDGLSTESFFGVSTGGDAPGPVALLARFRGFANGGSDKVPGVPEEVTPAGSGVPSVPEPATLMLAGVAAAAGLGCGCRSRCRVGRG